MWIFSFWFTNFSNFWTIILFRSKVFSRLKILLVEILFSIIFISFSDKIFKVIFGKKFLDFPFYFPNKFHFRSKKIANIFLTRILPSKSRFHVFIFLQDAQNSNNSKKYNTNFENKQKAKGMCFPKRFLDFQRNHVLKDLFWKEGSQNFLARKMFFHALFE